MKMRRALISVSDKTGVAEFARGLAELGWEVLSTGGTASLLKEQGVPVTPVSEVTGFPEILEGRVKTLHPAIHGGILARRVPEHLEELKRQGIGLIDMVVVNLYPFFQTISRPGVTLEEAVENIDIGGPAMVRAAAKNFEYVAVVVNPSRYRQILEVLRQQGEVPRALRMELAQEAFLHTSEYDFQVQGYLARQLGQEQKAEGMPQRFVLAGEKLMDLRYGENPHQKAAFYSRAGQGAAGVLQQLHGKELSYNNLLDLNSAWSLVQEFSAPAAVIIKHTNPCGAAQGSDLAEAYRRALDADPVSAFGGIVALNRPVDEKTASLLGEIFLEVIAAPSFEPGALDILRAKKNLRLLTLASQGEDAEYEIKTVPGGFLVQEADRVDLDLSSLRVVTKRQPTQEEWEDLFFAWKVVKHVKSNAIVVCRGQQTLGVGAGQMNRVGSVRIALEQAKEKARGAVLASDAFFPFRDSVDEAGRAGITAIIQPGGSVRDEESIQAADEYGMAMVFTGVRHFKHG